MDEVVILQWVEQVLKPYILEAPLHVVPLLLLDSYMCHMMASVITWVNELGVKVQHVQRWMHWPVPAWRCQSFQAT